MCVYGAMQRSGIPAGVKSSIASVIWDIHYKPHQDEVVTNDQWMKKWMKE